MSKEYTLDYKKGRLVIRIHSKVRDALGDVTAMLYGGSLRKPIVKEVHLDGKVPALIF